MPSRSFLSSTLLSLLLMLLVAPSTSAQVGACCLDEETCIDLTEEDCTAAGGEFQGEGRTCFNGACEMGASCGGEGGFECVVSRRINSKGGTWYPGRTCEPNPCFGACCEPLGGCTVTHSESCRTGGGYYFGDDTVCTPETCPDGACCNPYNREDDCLVTNSYGCSYVGGWFQGVDTACDPGLCNAACCFESGGCVVLGFGSCRVADGEFTPFSSCDPTPCPVSSPSAWAMNFSSPPEGNGLPDLESTQVSSFVDWQGSLVVGGDFPASESSPSANLGIWTGTDWLDLGQGTNGTVFALDEYDGELVVAGEFTAAGTLPAPNIARWDGTTWNSLGSGVNGTVRCLTTYDDDLIVGGSFTEAGGVPTPHLARWDGEQWSSLGVFDFTVEALVVYQGGLFAMGLFQDVDGQTRNHIARWDGVSWHDVDSGTDGRLRAGVVHQGFLVVGGSFAIAGNSASSNIASWDGESWANFSAGVDDEVWSLASHRGLLYVGGDLSQPAHLASWDGDNWNPVGAGLDDRVLSLASSAGELFVGGTFRHADELPSSRVAQYGVFGDEVSVPGDQADGWFDSGVAFLPGETVFLDAWGCIQSGSAFYSPSGG